MVCQRFPKHPHNRLIARFKELGIPLDDPALQEQLAWIEASHEMGRPDVHLQEILESAADELEGELLMSPFIEPFPTSGLDEGDVEIVTTPHGQRVRISFAKGRPNETGHICVSGQTGAGKSCLMAVIAYHAAPQSRTFIIDMNRFYRNIPAMHRRHAFVRWNHLKLTPWNGPPGLDPRVFDTVVNHELCDNFGLKFAEYEIGEVVSELRKAGTPNLIDVLQSLKTKKYAGFSKRGQYRDSAVLVLSNLLTSTRDLFRCKSGMNVHDLLFSGNIVLEADGLLPKIQAFLLRYFFEYLHGLAQEEEPQ